MQRCQQVVFSPSVDARYFREHRDAVANLALTRGHKNPLWYQMPHRVRQTRKRHTLTLLAVARLAGCSPPSVSRIERGECCPTCITAEALAFALKVSPVWLAFGVEGFVRFAQKQHAQDRAALIHQASDISINKNEHLNIGARCRLAREQRGFTLRPLGDMAGGLTAQAIIKIEEGVVIPIISTVEALAVALDVAPGWLAFGEGEGPAVQA